MKTVYFIEMNGKPQQVCEQLALCDSSPHRPRTLFSKDDAEKVKARWSPSDDVTIGSITLSDPIITTFAEAADGMAENRGFSL